MVSCHYCVFHKCKGAAHTCEHCKNKVVYGEMQEKFLEPCLYFKITLRERINRQRRQANEAPFIDEKRRLKKSEVKKILKDTSKLEQIVELKQLLREPKTILQIKNEMGLSDRKQVLRLIHVATFRISIYEGLTPDGDYYY